MIPSLSSENPCEILYFPMTENESEPGQEAQAPEHWAQTTQFLLLLLLLWLFFKIVYDCKRASRVLSLYERQNPSSLKRVNKKTENS